MPWFSAYPDDYGGIYLELTEENIQELFGMLLQRYLADVKKIRKMGTVPLNHFLEHMWNI